MCQHPACAAETRIRSKDCDVTIADRIGSRDAFPIPFPSFIYAVTIYHHKRRWYMYIIVGNFEGGEFYGFEAVSFLR